MVERTVFILQQLPVQYMWLVYSSKPNVRMKPWWPSCTRKLGLPFPSEHGNEMFSGCVRDQKNELERVRDIVDPCQKRQTCLTTPSIHRCEALGCFAHGAGDPARQPWAMGEVFQGCGCDPRLSM